MQLYGKNCVRPRPLQTLSIDLIGQFKSSLTVGWIGAGLEPSVQTEQLLNGF